MGALRRGLGVFVVLLAAYAATLGLDAAEGSRYTPEEAHRLLVAESIVSDGDLDLRDEYAERAWEDWYDDELVPTGQLTNGRLHEPQGVGLPLLIAPAYGIAGPTGAEILLAAMLAAAFAVAAALGRGLVPDPWPDRAALVVGLSPPALAASTTIAPATAGALLLTGAALLALRVRDRPRLRWTFWCAALVMLLPWLAVGLAVPGLVVALALARWLARRSRGLAGFVALEVVVMGAVVYVAVHDRLFGGPTPDAARLPGESATGIENAEDVLDRLPQVVGVLLDQEVGLLRWAPVLALVGWAAWRLHRSFRERLAVAIPERIDVEVAVGLLLAVVAATIVVAGIAPPSLQGPWLVPHDAPVLLPVAAALCAWGAQAAARSATLLSVLTLVGGAWLLIGARVDDGTGLAPPEGALPWGGLEQVLPRWDDPLGTPALVVSIAVGAVCAALAVREVLRLRRLGILP